MTEILASQVPSVWTDYTSTILNQAFPCGGTTTVPGIQSFVRLCVDQTQPKFSTYVVAQVYLQRMIEGLNKTKACTTDDTAHRLFIAALLVATKVDQDQTNCNVAAVISGCGGMYSLQQVLIMERCLCNALRHRLWVNDSHLSAMLSGMCSKNPELAVAGGDMFLAALQH